MSSRPREPAGRPLGPRVALLAAVLVLVGGGVWVLSGAFGDDPARETDTVSQGGPSPGLGHNSEDAPPVKSTEDPPTLKAEAPPSKSTLDAVRAHLRQSIKYRDKDWKMDFGWLRRTLQESPGGLHVLVAWYVLHEGEDVELALTAQRLILFSSTRPPWLKEDWPAVQAQLRSYVSGSVKLPTPERWPAAAAFLASVPAKDLARVEATGLAFAQRSFSPARYYEALARLGARSSAFHSRVLELLDEILRSESPDVLASWTPDAHIATLVEARASAVPEDLVTRLLATKAPAYYSIGLRVLAATAENDRDVHRVVKSIPKLRLKSPYREYTTAALMRWQPTRIKASLPRMLSLASSRSYFDEFLTADAQKAPGVIASMLKAGTLIWDPERKLIRKP